MSNTTKRETRGNFCGTAIVNLPNIGKVPCQIFNHKKHFLAKKNNTFQRFVSSSEVMKTLSVPKTEEEANLMMTI